MSTADSTYGDLKSLAEHLRRTRPADRKADAAHARRTLDRLMDALNEFGAFGDLETLVKELRADGFTEAAFHAIQALPLLKQAETHLERAKGKVA